MGDHRDDHRDESGARSFDELADAAASGRPQFIRRNGQVLILIAKTALDDACLKAIRAQLPDGQDPPPDDDAAYPEARGLFTAPLRRRD